MWGQQRTGRTPGRQLRRIGAGLGAGALVVGLTLGPARPAAAVDLVDWYGRDYPGQGSTATGTSTGTPATSSESRGIVLIDTELYTGSEAAGTGIVLSSSGMVVTNYHVVEGSTAIRVTVATTGRTYTAKLVGADKTADIAVLKLQGASGLTPAAIDNDALRVGDDVTAVGNAGGTGSLTAADGEVTALNQKITTEAEDTVSGETLTGLIQTDADVQAGDSGGPLFDSQNEVTGIDAAASSGGPTAGYAIPISTALGIVRQIESGRSSTDIRIGAAAYLGVQVTTATSGSTGSSGGWGSYDDPWGNSWGNSYGDPFGNSYGDPYGNSDGNSSGGQTVSGAEIVGVQDSTPAAKAGLAAGDVITRVGSTTITSADDLTNALSNYRPGDKVSVGWTDANGQQHSATVTLGSSPVN